MGSEPLAAFPHLPPTQCIREQYAGAFCLAEHPRRWTKNLFDHVVGSVCLLAVCPLMLGIALAHVLLCTLEGERGPLVISYLAVSRGRVFRKYKYRVVRRAHIDASAAGSGDWQAYSMEWDPRCRTYLGRFLKKFYLDELPQLFSVASGQMSFVGPRPLAVHHFQRDLAQGNVHRRLLKAGLFGPSQALKGTRWYGSQDEEYKYLDAVTRMTAWRLLCYDLKLIAAGLLRVAEGRGL